MPPQRGQSPPSVNPRLSLASSLPFLNPPNPAMLGWCPSFSMNALLFVNGSCFQAVPDESFLGIQTPHDEFHSGVHFERGLFIIDGQKHTVRSVIKCEEHRAYATQAREHAAKIQMELLPQESVVQLCTLPVRRSCRCVAARRPRCERNLGGHSTQFSLMWPAPPTTSAKRLLPRIEPLKHRRLD